MKQIPNEIAILKQNLRQRFRAERARQRDLQTTDAEHLRLRIAGLNANLQKNLPAVTRDTQGVWTAFRALPDEPAIDQTVHEMRDVEWAFPRMIGDELEFFRLKDSQGFVLAEFGIQEPAPRPGALPVEPLEFAALLVPGLAFDEQCNRLGRGRGFYDRFLSRLKKQNTNIVAIGVAFEWQISSQPLPVESFDFPMAAVITESRVIVSAQRNVS